MGLLSTRIYSPLQLLLCFVVVVAEPLFSDDRKEKAIDAVDKRMDSTRSEIENIMANIDSIIKKSEEWAFKEAKARNLDIQSIINYRNIIYNKNSNGKPENVSNPSAENNEHNGIINESVKKYLYIRAFFPAKIFLKIFFKLIVKNVFSEFVEITYGKLKHFQIKEVHVKYLKGELNRIINDVKGIIDDENELNQYASTFFTKFYERTDDSYIKKQAPKDKMEFFMRIKMLLVRCVDYYKVLYVLESKKGREDALTGGLEPEDKEVMKRRGELNSQLELYSKIFENEKSGEFLDELDRIIKEEGNETEIGINILNIWNELRKIMEKISKLHKASDDEKDRFIEENKKLEDKRITELYNSIVKIVLKIFLEE